MAEAVARESCESLTYATSKEIFSLPAYHPKLRARFGTV